MGYRSDVYMRFDQSIMEMVDAARQFDQELDKILDEGMTEKPTDFHWSDVKWCSINGPVSAVENLMNELESNTDADGAEWFGFIRVGEADDDVERRGHPDGHDMYTHTQVEW